MLELINGVVNIELLTLVFFSVVVGLSLTNISKWILGVFRGVPFFSRVV